MISTQGVTIFQLATLQIQYGEVCAANDGYRTELDKYSTDYQELQLEVEKLRSENDVLMTDLDIKNKALSRLEEKRQEAVKSLSVKESALQVYLYLLLCKM